MGGGLESAELGGDFGRGEEEDVFQWVVDGSGVVDGVVEVHTQMVGVLAIVEVIGDERGSFGLGDFG